jgi:hypothetical protein
VNFKSSAENNIDPPRDRTLALLKRGSGVLLILCLVYGVCARVRPTFLPDDNLVTFTGDDMYYYLNIAANLVEKGLPSFDGEIATNGFHPLYTALLLPITAAVHDAGMRIRVILWMLTLLDILTALALMKAFFRFGSPIAGILFASLWMVLPFAMDVSNKGMESSLAAFGFALVLYSLALFLAAERPSIKSRLLLAVSLAILFLARTDAGWYVLPIVLWAFKKDFQGFDFPHMVRRALLVPLVSLALVSPWMIWNRIRFGSFVQQSLQAQIMRADYTRRMDGAAPNFLADFIRTLIENLKWNAMWTAWWFGVPLALVAFAAWVLVRRNNRRDPDPLHATSILLLVGALLFHLCYGALLHVMPPHYFVLPVLTLLFLVFAWSSAYLEIICNSGVWKSVVFSAVIFLLILPNLFQDVFKRASDTGPFFWQRSMYVAAQQVKNNLPRGARIASFNSGILGYFSGRYVMNIDGVVNPEIIDAFQSKRMASYLENRRIEYLVEHGKWLFHYAAAFDKPMPETYAKLFEIPGPIWGSVVCLKRKVPFPDDAKTGPQ